MPDHNVIGIDASPFPHTPDFLRFDQVGHPHETHYEHLMIL